MNILLYITGSISCYKSYDLARGLINNGHQVRVTLSKGAEKFIRPELFHYLGANSVYKSTDDFSIDNMTNLGSNNPVRHIELARWADLFVVAPCTANTIGHFANGITKDLGTTVFLALEKKIQTLIFPAMNPQMLGHSRYKKNIMELNELDSVHVFPTQEGLLACGDHGKGKLLEVRQVINLVESFPTTSFKNKNVLITTGASIAPLDDVRYLTNPSSGITGLQFARDFLKQGMNVTVVAGKTSTGELDDLIPHPNFKLFREITTDDFYNRINETFASQDLYISAAAISDIKFSKSKGKLKKDQFTGQLEYNTDTDILKEMIKIKHPNQKIIGFAAETQFEHNELQEKWNRKPVDMLIATKVHNGSGKSQGEGFGDVKANYQLYENNKIYLNANLSKKELSAEVTKWADQWFN